MWRDADWIEGCQNGDFLSIPIRILSACQCQRVPSWNQRELTGFFKPFHKFRAKPNDT